MNTLEQYEKISATCRALFSAKIRDYGTPWRILRSTSLTDQLLIKAKRIRSIEQKGQQLVEDNVDQDYMGLINYSLIALIQSDLTENDPIDLSVEDALGKYDHWAGSTKALMLRKNHDYGEVWREMRLSSITDLILVKLLRIKQIEENDGKTVVSEGIRSNLMDIINYAAFALIRIGEAAHKS